MSDPGKAVVHMIDTDEGFKTLDSIIGALPEADRKAITLCFDHFHRTQEFAKRSLDTSRMLDDAIRRVP